MEKSIQQVERYIQDKLCEPLNLNHLAELACLSPVHFHRRFKANTGCTPARFVELHKVRQSLELLKEAVQVQDVAFELGFANYETFSRAFKRHCKMAPSDFQRLLQRLKEQMNPETPIVLSRSAELPDLLGLVENGLKRGIIMQDHFPCWR